jgi:hypothetical protein
MYLLLLFLSLAVFTALTIWYVRQDFASVFHPISFYLLFHGFVFVLRPFFAHWGHYSNLYRAYQFFPSPETKLMVIVAANIGLLAFVLGAWRTGSTPLVFRQGPAAIAKRQLLINPYLLVCAVLVPIAAYSLWSGVTATRVTMRLDSSTGVAINTTDNGWFVDAQLLLVPLGVLFAWIFRFRFWSLAPLMSFVLLRASTGARGAFVVACVAAALLWLYDRKMRAPSPRLLALLALLVVAFYAVGQDRGAAVRGLLEDGRLIEVRQQQGFIESMDFANLEFFEYIVETIPGKTGTYGYFTNNLQILTEPIPRVLWKDKPIGPPIKLYNLFDFGSPIGMTFSLPGEGWAQAGIVGVILWCGLWGLCLGAFYSYFARGRQTNFQVAIYLCFLPVFVIAFRDGVLITVVRNAVFYLAPVALWKLAADFLPAGSPRSLSSGHSGFGNPDPAAMPPEPRRELFSRRRPHLRVAEEPIVPRAWRRGETTQPAE